MPLLLLFAVCSPVRMKSSPEGVEGRKAGDEVRVLWVEGRVVQEGALFDGPRGTCSLHRCFHSRQAEGKWAQVRVRGETITRRRAPFSQSRRPLIPPHFFRNGFSCTQHTAGSDRMKHRVSACERGEKGETHTHSPLAPPHLFPSVHRHTIPPRCFMYGGDKYAIRK